MSFGLLLGSVSAGLPTAANVSALVGNVHSGGGLSMCEAQGYTGYLCTPLQCSVLGFF